jgi:hypothetical protein
MGKTLAEWSLTSGAAGCPQADGGGRDMSRTFLYL